jgi:anti-anti-sigma factor
MTDLARLSYAPDDEVVVARLEGELDVTNTETIESELLETLTAQGASMILDLAPTTYIDSAGIRMLFDLAARLRARGRELRLAMPEGAVTKRALVLTQVDQVAPIHTTVAEAKSALSAAV